MENTVIFEKKRIDVLNIPVDIVPPESMEKIITGMFSNGEYNQIVLIRLQDLMRARRNQEFRSILKKSALVLPVSKSIIGGASFLKKGKPYRFMPFEFIIRLLGILEKHGQSVYLLSSAQKNLQTSEQNLKASFPGLKIVGRYTGYFQNTASEDIVLAIKKASPTLLLAGRGIKGKDKWLYENRQQFNPGVFFWSGECFDIFCGKKQKMSKFIWEHGLEFFPRFFTNPLRFFRIFLFLYYCLLVVLFRILKR